MQRFGLSSHKVGSPLAVEKYIPGYGRQWVKVRAGRIKEISKVNPDFAKNGLQLARSASNVCRAFQLVHAGVKANAASSPRPLLEKLRARPKA